MTPPFATASAVVLTREDNGRWRFVADVPDGWQQGPGAFGGLVVGTLVRAMTRACADPVRQLRAVSADIVEPIPVGPVDVEVELLRRGKSMSAFDARLLRDGKLLARASASFGASRPSPRLLSPDPPVSFDWRELSPAAVEAPIAPVFTQHYFYRVLPPYPYEGGPAAAAAGFISEKEPPAQLDAAHVVGLLDAWWPAQHAVETIPRQMTTVSFTAELLVDPATLDPAAPLRYRAHTHAAADGYAVELRELWRDATLVALNQQTFVTVK